MKISGAHINVVSNECVNFRNYNILGQNHVLKRGTDEQTDRLTNMLNPIYRPPPQHHHHLQNRCYDDPV